MCSPTTAATGASTQLLAYGSYLRSRYQAQVPSFANQWPPPPSAKIFNLAMIKKERVERGRIDEEYVRLTITGKVGDILHKKVPVKLEEMFELNEKKRKVILIEGAPGSGKVPCPGISARGGVQGNCSKSIKLWYLFEYETQKLRKHVRLLIFSQHRIGQWLKV